MSIKFSIIIPAYNAEPYIYELLDCLNKQMTDEVEVILIDDGSKNPVKANYDWLKLYRQKNKGISKTRNRGLELAKGEVIGFIDADDLVSENYVSSVLDALKNKEWDYVDMSWKSLEDDHFWFKLSGDNDSLGNPSACTRVFKKSFIGDHRFPEKKDAAEDEHFTRHLEIKKAKHVCITDFMYFYRTSTPESNSKLFMRNVCNTKRIAYYYNHVKADMTNLLEEVKKEDETNEVYVLTNKNDIPELEKYSHVFCPPRHVRVMEHRGEPSRMIEIVEKPLVSQIVIWTSVTFEIGGIETFIYSFCKHFHKKYDIMVLYDTMGNTQLARLAKMVRCVKNDINKPVHCDTLIINRIIDNVPSNIHFNRSVQMVHCLKHPSYHIPQQRDIIVNVSQASKDSFGAEAKRGIVIHNLTAQEDKDECLLLVSALRVGAEDKQGNDKRCIQFAQRLKDVGIPFIWVYFGDKPMMRAPEELIYGGLKRSMTPYIKKADYLVQLSGAEAFSYSLLESLELQTPVIVTPLEQNKDMKIVDGENAYVFPFEASEWTDDMIRRIATIPKFKYKHDNDEIIKQWVKILGKRNTNMKYEPVEEVAVKVRMDYFDIQLQRTLRANNVVMMLPERATELRDKGFVTILGE